MSIEAFAMTNLLMNFLILTVSARCVGHIRWKRVICAGMLGTLYAVVVYARPEWTWLRSMPFQLLGLLGMALVVFGDRTLRAGWAGCVYIAAGVIFAGGLLLLLSRWVPVGSPALTILGCGTIAAAAFLSDRFRAGEQIAAGQIELRIGTRMGVVQVRALIDTGNRLREPLSGLPVIIVERESLEGILGEVCLRPHQRRLLPGFRRVSYSVLGGSGEMICFRPESVMVRREETWERAPEVWIGIYQGRLPSSMEALAPSALAQEGMFYGG